MPRYFTVIVAALFLLGKFGFAQVSPHQASLLWPLKRAQTMTFMASVRLYGDPARGKKYHSVRGMDLLVQACKPGSLRIETSVPADWQPTPGNDVIAIGNVNVFVTNGKKQYAYHTKMSPYYQEKAAPALSMLQSNFDLVNQISPDILFGSGLNHFKYTGQATLEGMAVNMYSFTESDGRRRMKKVLYIDPKTSLPVRVSQYLADGSGAYAERQRVDYSHWRLNPSISSTLFTFSPPPGTIPPHQDR